MFGPAISQRTIQNGEKKTLFISSEDINKSTFLSNEYAIVASLSAKLCQPVELIKPYELLIAAQTMRASVTPITANTHELNRIPGLTVIDWAT